jgi:hypothetical protein
MPSNFKPFGPLKKHVAGKEFTTDAGVKKNVMWQQTLNSDFSV